MIAHAAIGRGVLGNKAASGTEIIAELGEEHLRTGGPIVYTSGDSVFQIATHKSVVDLPLLYEWSRAARRLLVGPHNVGRVIARPFAGPPGAYARTSTQALSNATARYAELLADLGLVHHHRADRPCHRCPVQRWRALMKPV